MTGYTHELVEKNQTFQQFAMSCAKAFGANIVLRDEPSDTPIPNEYQPTDYHVNAIAQSRKDLAEFVAMASDKQLAWAEGEKRRNIDNANESVVKDKSNLDKQRLMLDQVNAWTPPTSDHLNFKEFMVDQLAKSIEWESGTSYWDAQLAILKSQDSETLVANHIAQFHTSIACHTTEHAKEVSRVADRNKWNRILRESLVKP